MKINKSSFMDGVSKIKLSAEALRIIEKVIQATPRMGLELL